MKRLLLAALVAVGLMGFTPGSWAQDVEAPANQGPTLSIDLNRADAQELIQLPGIGPARAQAIVDYRTRHGPFRRIAQLLRIRGIGRATLRRLRPFLVISPHPVPASAPHPVR